MYSLGNVVEAILGIKTTMIVACPLYPVMIPGITAADELDAYDCMGTVVEVLVPKRGILVSASFFDLDDENTQVNLHVFKQSITQIASDAAWAPSDEDMLKRITRLAFFSFDDNINSRAAEINNIGKAYVAPEGKFYIQAQVGATAQTIAAGASPRFQLQIQSFDPDFVER